MLMFHHDAPLSVLKHATLWLSIIQIFLLVNNVACERKVPGVPHVAALRSETEQLFYHGFDNYMKHAFPEDELRSVTCKPLTRDSQNPDHVEVNDVLGNYSLTLVDSLSTLAILASSSDDSRRKRSLLLFQNAVRDLVELYGDGTNGPAGQGKRAKGFDLDSKVQVFETAIRGLGGLLSAHLFAVGELPITGYNPSPDKAKKASGQDTASGIQWSNGFIYNGQLLRLAHDLGLRLVPAFWTSTGIPYPRVNLRHGIPFYAQSTGNFAPEGQCATEQNEPAEVTETCSAGAGSLVLEFTVLSRLTNDVKFEELAKRAFWAIWERRSSIDLVGAGIDAESGTWKHSWTGIGAGIDSFFEYAFKSHILLSGSHSSGDHEPISQLDPRSLFSRLSDKENSAEAFLSVWQKAHAAIKRHMFRDTNFQHPHYIQVDQNSGAARAFWVDALSAFYPGLLAMSGHIEEAIQTHLVSTAIWARYSGLPERYSMATGNIEGGLGWWVGRPELIESTWYLYRATEDPWYIYVGEMILRDIKRRCWTECGWAGLQNVVSGEKIDRMESFFLGETAKYLFLLFEPEHPLNKLDAPFVFTTEGHPLIIPKRSVVSFQIANQSSQLKDDSCPARPISLPLSISNVAARGDVYHAASLARLHLMPKRGQVESVLTEYAADHPSITLADVHSPSNWTYYPWTLPVEMIPYNATSSKMSVAHTFELAFPTMQNQGNTNAPLQRLNNGILVNFMGGLRLSLVQDVPMLVNDDLTFGFRIHGVNNIALGKDEKVYLTQGTGPKLLNPHDPLFTKVRDTTMLDIVVDTERLKHSQRHQRVNASLGKEMGIEMPEIKGMHESAVRAAWQSIIAQLSNLVNDAQGFVVPMDSRDQSNMNDQDSGRVLLPATTPTGIGAAPLPDWQEASTTDFSGGKETSLLWTKIYAAGELCDEKLPAHVLRSYEVVLIKRGSCSFSQKLSNFPLVNPSKSTFQLAIIIDYGDDSGMDKADDATVDEPVGEPILIRPLLDEPQKSSSGLLRQHPLPMLLIGGGERSFQLLKKARSVGIKRRYSMTSQGIPITNLILV